MSKLIPPPPPKPKTKRARSKVHYMTPEVQRSVLRRSGRRTPDTMEQAARDYMVPVEGGSRIPGAPAPVTSNMPAVANAVGATDERGAQRKREQAYKVGYDGRTSNLPELGGTPRKNDVKRARKDQ